MQRLTVEARSLGSAQGIEAALVGFDRERVTEGGHFLVHVTLPAGGEGIIAVLHALEAYVSEEGTVARIRLDGRSYTMEGPSIEAPPLQAPPLETPLLDA